MSSSSATVSASKNVPPFEKLRTDEMAHGDLRNYVNFFISLSMFKSGALTSSESILILIFVCI